MKGAHGHSGTACVARTCIDSGDHLVGGLTPSGIVLRVLESRRHPAESVSLVTHGVCSLSL